MFVSPVIKAIIKCHASVFAIQNILRDMPLAFTHTPIMSLPVYGQKQLCESTCYKCMAVLFVLQCLLSSSEAENDEERTKELANNSKN